MVLKRQRTKQQGQPLLWWRHGLFRFRGSLLKWYSVNLAIYYSRISAVLNETFR